MATLRERIPAPSQLELPSPVSGIVFRPGSRDDLVGMHAVAVAAAALDDPRARPSTADLDRSLSTEGLIVDLDTVVGVDADGRVQAYGIVIDVPSRVTAARAVLSGAVHPRYRSSGVGRRLLAWQVGRARQRLAALDIDLPATLDIGGRSGAPVLALAERLGFRPVRHWVEMELVFADHAVDGPPMPVFPDGLVLRPAAPDDIEPMRAAKNDAFRDHWGSQPMVASDWRGFLTAPKSRLDLSRLVVDPLGNVLAFAVVEVDPDGFAARGRAFGSVHWVGVTRSARGRGLAPLVLGAALAAMRADGLSAAVLDVDTENPSGAARIYERLGFVRGEVHVTAAVSL
ncbi:GNAT family N-acetyltransferase [Curtobacterium sp. MCLR17_043]|uniref:GNAT family N-acetyltransferase n=1 Tax=Curtobacterium sp. MCLR17_043 TaxID=2175627 RepID=UPI0011B4B550|nr:GNAT family N-acetyltransferase [Curtobacterium sp. MCLR17_043]